MGGSAGIQRYKGLGEMNAAYYVRDPFRAKPRVTTCLAAAEFPLPMARSTASHRVQYNIEGTIQPLASPNRGLNYNMEATITG
jgi:hypothetical protein